MSGTELGETRTDTTLLTRRVAMVAVLMLSILGVTGSVPSASAAGVGQYSAPEYWPLRSAFVLSCTNGNPGCSGYHGYWALDIGAPRGTSIYAAGAGKVVTAIGDQGTNCPTALYSWYIKCPNGSKGNKVVVDHGSGRYSFYTHMTSVTVAVGAWVAQSTPIGTVGDSGWSDPGYTHLHFERMQGSSTSTAGTAASIDPVPLRACVSGVLKTYPHDLGYGSWGLVPRYTSIPAASISACGLGGLGSGLAFIKTKNTDPNTRRVEIHTATAASGYSSGAHNASYLGAGGGSWGVGDSNNGWFSMQDLDADGRPDLVFIKTKNTDPNTRRVEIHTATAASGYSSGAHNATYLGNGDADNGWFSMQAASDLI